MSISYDQAHSDGMEVAAVGATLLAQTLSFGIYLALIPFAVRITLRRGVQGFMNKLVFGLMLTSCAIATGYFIFNIYSWFLRMERNFIHFVPADQRPDNSATKYYDLWNAIVLINPALTDGAVLWRAWVICSTSRKSRVVLFITLASLVICFASAFVTVGLRSSIIYNDVHSLMSKSDPRRQMAVDILNQTQLFAVVCSLVTNLLATGCITARVWSLRRAFVDLPSSSKRIGLSVEDILVLMVESGLLYSFSTIFFIGARFIPLPRFSLATYYEAVHVNISAIYPAILLIMVDRKQERWHTTTEKPGDITLSLGFEITSGDRDSVGTGYLESAPIGETKSNAAPV